MTKLVSSSDLNEAFFYQWQETEVGGEEGRLKILAEHTDKQFIF